MQHLEEAFVQGCLYVPYQKWNSFCTNLYDSNARDDSSLQPNVILSMSDICPAMTGGVQSGVARGGQTRRAAGAGSALRGAWAIPGVQCSGVSGPGHQIHC